jgi:hypothetical protein
MRAVLAGDVALTVVSTVVYPIVAGAAIGVALTSLMLVVSSRFDPTQGTLTISLLITIGMLCTVGYCLIYTIPQDDITPGVVGGLTAGFGAVVAHWLGRTRGGPPQSD